MRKKLRIFVLAFLFFTAMTSIYYYYNFFDVKADDMYNDHIFMTLLNMLFALSVTLLYEPFVRFITYAVRKVTKT